MQNAKFKNQNLQNFFAKLLFFIFFVTKWHQNFDFWFLNFDFSAHRLRLARLFFDNRSAKRVYNFSQATKSHWWMIWRLKAMKDVASCDKHGGGANSLWFRDVRMGQPSCREIGILIWIHRIKKLDWVNWNILVTQGRESNCDSPSSGERKGKSLNLWYVKLQSVVSEVLRAKVFSVWNERGRVDVFNWMVWKGLPKTVTAR